MNSLRRLLKFTVALAAALSLSAQVKPDKPTAERRTTVGISGFVDNILHFEELLSEPDNWLANTTRGTFRVNINHDDKYEVKVGVVGRMSHGSNDLNLVPFLPVPMQDALLPGAVRYFHNTLENDLYLQEAYITFKRRTFRLRVGRQKFSTGTGYAFNPTDLFNQKNPIDPTYENDGIDAALLTIPVFGSREVEFFVSPSRTRSPDFLARMRGGYGIWQFGAQFSSVERERTDWSSVNNPRSLTELQSGTTLDHFARQFRWYQPALEFRRTGERVDVYGEAGYVFIEAAGEVGTLVEGEKNHERLLVGVKPETGEKVSVVFEYMRLGEGTRHTRPVSLNDMMAYNKGTILSTNKDTLFGEAGWQATRRIELQFQTTIGVNHLTVYLNPWVHVMLHPGVRLSFAVYSATGADHGAYVNVGPGAFARLRWDF